MKRVSMKQRTLSCCLVSFATAFLSCRPEWSEEASLINAVREQSNQALAAHDTVSLAQCFTVDYNAVTSVNVASAGRSLFLERMSKRWESRPDLIYRRTPSTIDVFPGWKMAGETGRWEGTWTELNGDKIRIAGTYYAKWHKIDGAWLIRAEIFAPLRCVGAKYCSTGPLLDQ